MTAAVGQASPFSDAHEWNLFSFMFDRKMDDVQTMTVAEVKAVDTDAQTVDVLVLVNLITGGGLAQPHGIIYSRPYFRLQGGVNAIIVDPAPGDIGLLVFASRDISAVVSTRGQANPGSSRRFTWSDGVFFGGALNDAPTQYLQFSTAGATLVSTATVQITAETGITLTAPTTTVTGNLALEGTMTGSNSGASSSLAGSLSVSGTLHGGTLTAGNGASGTFTTTDGKTVTVNAGIITSIT